MVLVINRAVKEIAGICKGFSSTGAIGCIIFLHGAGVLWCRHCLWAIVKSGCVLAEEGCKVEWIHRYIILMVWCVKNFSWWCVFCDGIITRAFITWSVSYNSCIGSTPSKISGTHADVTCWGSSIRMIWAILECIGGCRSKSSIAIC